MDRQNVTPEKKYTFMLQRITWYRNRGCKRTPKVLICRKSEQNRWKVEQKWRPMLFDFNKWHPTFPGNTWRPFLDVIPKKGIHDLWSLWRNFVGNVPQSFSGKFGKIRSKIFCTPKNLLLLNLCTSTDFQTKSGWCLDTKETESHFD